MKRILTTAAVLVALATGAPLGAQTTGRVFTHEDMIAAKRLGTVAASPDGRQAVMQVLTYSYERPGPDGDLWIVDLETSGPGGEPRRLTSAPGVESSPTWSPDGTTIVFVVRATDGPAQLHRIPATGGAPVQLTTLSTGASLPRFSPDGRTIAFLSNVFPTARDDAENAARLKAARESPSSARIYTGFPYRDYGNQWFDGRVNHLMTMPAGGGAPRALLTGTRLVREPGWSGVMEYDWRPGSQAIVFSASIDFHKQADRFDTKDLYVVESGPAGSVEPTLLVDAQTNDRNPVFSPDGRYLAWHAVWCCWGGFETDQDQASAGYPKRFDPNASYRDNRILVRDMQTGVVTVLMAGWDRPPEAPAWSADGRELYFAAPDDGHNRLFRISLQDGLKGGRPAVLAGPPGAWGGPVVAGHRVLAARQRATRPPELYAIDVRATAGQPRQVSDLNGALFGQFAMNQAEEVFWDYRGRKIQGWLVKPPAFDPAKRYPLFLFPHGGPFGAHADIFHYRWNAQIFAAHGYVVFMPNPTGSTGFGERFAAEIQGEWGGRVFEEVMAGVDHLLASSAWLDGDRMVAGSASYGGYFMNWLITQTDRFKAVFTHASIWNFVSMTGASIISHYMLADASNRSPWEDFAAFNKYSPHYHAARIKTPTYVSHGGQDAGVPDGQGMELYWTLQRLGVESRFIYFPDEGHHILKPANSRVFYKEMLDWFAAHLR